MPLYVEAHTASWLGTQSTGAQTRNEVSVFCPVFCTEQMTPFYLKSVDQYFLSFYFAQVQVLDLMLKLLDL